MRASLIYIEKRAHQTTYYTDLMNKNLPDVVKLKQKPPPFFFCKKKKKVPPAMSYPAKDLVFDEATFYITINIILMNYHATVSRNKYCE